MHHYASGAAHSFSFESNRVQETRLCAGTFCYPSARRAEGSASNGPSMLRFRGSVRVEARRVEERARASAGNRTKDKTDKTDKTDKDRQESLSQRASRDVGMVGLDERWDENCNVASQAKQSQSGDSQFGQLTSETERFSQLNRPLAKLVAKGRPQKSGFPDS